MSEEQNIKEQSTDNSPQLSENLDENQQNVEQQQTTNLPTGQAGHKLQTETMEAPHSHHPTHKKKWFEYLLEFFMLFLAVFLGFVAENIREHYVDRQKEKEYMKSLTQDLRSDTLYMQRNIDFGTIVSKKLDTFINVLNFPNPDVKDQMLYRLKVETSRMVQVTFDDRTSHQLKNSVSMRLSKKI